MRLIDADRLSDVINNVAYVPICIDCYTKHEILELIDEQPTVQQWILVSERMPDELETVLVTSGNGTIYLAEYEQEYGFDGIDDVIAWMPLPEPYRPEPRKE